MTAGLMVAPTVLFLGLCRLLEWLRDDRLLAELSRREEVSGPLQPTLGDLVDSEDDALETRRCGACGTWFHAELSSCHRCGESP